MFCFSLSGAGSLGDRRTRRSLGVLRARGRGGASRRLGAGHVAWSGGLHRARVLAPGTPLRCREGLRLPCGSVVVHVHGPRLDPDGLFTSCLCLLRHASKRLLCGVVQRTGVKRVCLSPLVPLDQCACGVLAGAMVRASRGVPGCPGVSCRGLWPEGRRPLTSCSCLFPRLLCHEPGSRVSSGNSRTHSISSMHPLPRQRMICDRFGLGGCDVGRNDRKAGRMRCRATRGKAPGEAWEGDGRGPLRGHLRRDARRRACGDAGQWPFRRG